MTTPPLAEQIELDRDRMCRRHESLRVESAVVYLVNGKWLIDER